MDVWLDSVVPELDERRRLEDERSRIEDPLSTDHSALSVLSSVSWVGQRRRRTLNRADQALPSTSMMYLKVSSSAKVKT